MGNNLRRLRIYRGVTRGDMVERIGRSSLTLDGLSRAERLGEISASDLMAVARFLGSSPKKLEHADQFKDLFSDYAFSERIRKYCRDKGVGVPTLAKRAGVPRHVITALLDGRSSNMAIESEGAVNKVLEGDGF